MSKLIIALIATLNVGTAFSQIFEKVENIPPVETNTGSRGVIFLDLNKDGFSDLYVVNGPRGGENNELYYNDQNGSFTRATNEASLDNSATVGASFGDVDNDGHLDAYLANWYNESNIYLQGSDGGFVRESVAGLGSRGHSESAAWGDFDGDGFLDLVIANSSFGNGERNVFVVHQQNGEYAQLQNIVTEGLVNSRSVNWIDANNDGRLDLFIGNEQAGNELYINVAGELVRDSLNAFLTSRDDTFGSGWDDVDNDGDLDLLVVNFGSSNWIAINDGNAIFNSQRVGASGGFSIGSTFGDVDNDGDLDLYITNGFAPTGTTAANELLINDGKGSFTAISSDPSIVSTTSSYGAAMADYDDDGFLDLFVANTHGTPNNFYKNLGNDNNWIKVKCEGTLSNLSSIGATIKIKATINGEDLWQMRHVSSQTGYTSQNDLKVHFGLGDAAKIDSLVITWPSGNQLVERDVIPNQTLVFSEPVEAGQLRPNFAVSEVAFDSNFEVTLKNLSAFSEEDEVTFSWDFDGDGQVDSNEFEPVATFEGEGNYPIQLTASNGVVTKEYTREVPVSLRLTLGATDSVQVEIFPNPTERFIRMQAAFTVEELRILTLDGKEVRKVVNPSEEISIADLPSGTYFLKILMMGEVVTRQLVIK